jgi:hypothetical protein
MSLWWQATFSRLLRDVCQKGFGYLVRFGTLSIITKITGNMCEYV